MKWQSTVTQTVERLSTAEPRQPLDVVLKRINDTMKILKEHGMNIPKVVKASDASEWLKQMKQYKEEYKNVSGFVGSCSLYSEIMLDENMNRYCKWFTHKTTGVWEQLKASENAVLQNWKDILDKGLASYKSLMENNYFLEDMKKPIDDAEASKQLIMIYRDALKYFRNDSSLCYQEDIKAYDVFIAQASKLPSARDVKFEGYEGGTFKTSHTNWTYDKFSGILASENISAAILEPPTKWDVRNAFLYQNSTYGTIIWNGKTWVWTHPKCQFTIRYDWEPQRSVFYQVMPPKDPKKQSPPSLSDWQIKDSSVNAVTVGKKETPPAVPQDVVLPYKGNIPPSLVLLVALFTTIKPIARGL